MGHHLEYCRRSHSLAEGQKHRGGCCWSMYLNYIIWKIQSIFQKMERSKNLVTCISLSSGGTNEIDSLKSRHYFSIKSFPSNKKKRER